MRKPRLLLFALCVILCAVGAPAQTTSPVNAPPDASAAKTSAKPASGSTLSGAQIAAAKASGLVWVNTDSGIYHKGGRWYGKTKAGKFMSEADARKAGYKASANN